MGITESSFKTLTNPLQSCVSEVLGSFDCTLKSKCCEQYKCLNFYYHCRTNQKDIDSSDDDELIATPPTIDTN